jgi:RimJ/RimL family protein N-acetyltransferase
VSRAQLGLISHDWGGCLRLSRLNAVQHAPLLYPLFHGENAEFVWDYLRDGPFLRFDHYQQHLAAFEDRLDVLALVVEDISLSRVVGKLLVIKMSPRAAAVEIAYVLFSPSVHGSGVAAAAVGTLLDYIFFSLRIPDCRWKCDKLNVRSARFAKKAGFVFEQEIISDFATKGRQRDTLVFLQSLKSWSNNRTTLIKTLRYPTVDTIGQTTVQPCVS